MIQSGFGSVSGSGSGSGSSCGSSSGSRSSMLSWLATPTENNHSIGTGSGVLKSGSRSGSGSGSGSGRGYASASGDDVGTISSVAQRDQDFDHEQIQEAVRRSLQSHDQEQSMGRRDRATIDLDAVYSDGQSGGTSSPTKKSRKQP